MAAPVSNDPEEARIAELLKFRLRDRGITHEALAERVGVSPGRVSQWATNRGAVPADRAFLVAENLGLNPDDVSLSWRRLRNEFEASQLSRLNAAIILRTIQRMREATEKVEGEAVDVEADPELFAEMLRLSVLEARGHADDERRVWPAGGQGRGTVGAAGKAKAGTAKGAASSAGRKRASSA